MTWTLISPGDSGISAPIVANFKHGFWGQAVYDADTGGDDTYVVTLNPAPTSISAGMIINFKVTTANTGECTLNPNSLGATAIKKNVSHDLETGDIIASTIVSVIFDGTNFQLLNPQNVEKMWCSSNDTTKGYLEDKITVDSSLTKTTSNDGGNEAVNIVIATDGIKDTHIDWGTGAGQVNLDDIPNGTTNKNFLGKMYYAYSLDEEANHIIISSDKRSKMFEFKCALIADTSVVSNFRPGVGANDNLIIFSTLHSVSGVFGYSVNTAPGVNSVAYASGMFYSESGIAAPAGTDAISFSSGLILDASQDATSLFDTDCFLYTDSTTGYLTLHVGTLNSTYTHCEMILCLSEIDIVDLGAL